MKPEIKAQRNKWNRNNLLITNRKGDTFQVKVSRELVEEAKKSVWRIQRSHNRLYVMTGYGQPFITKDYVVQEIMLGYEGTAQLSWP